MVKSTLVDILTYIILVWVELTVFAVALPIIGFLLIGRFAKVGFVLNLLRTKYIIHYIRSLNGRLLRQIILDKQIKTFGKSKYIPYRGFWYQLKEDKFFLDGTNIAIAHDFNKTEPLEFLKHNSIAVFENKSNEYTAQETESAIEAKVVLDLNKSIYASKDIMLIIIMAFVGIMTAVNLYFSYEASQQLAQIGAFLAHQFGTGTPAP